MKFSLLHCLKNYLLLDKESKEELIRTSIRFVHAQLSAYRDLNSSLASLSNEELKDYTVELVSQLHFPKPNNRESYFGMYLREQEMILEDDSDAHYYLHRAISKLIHREFNFFGDRIKMIS